MKNEDFQNACKQCELGMRAVAVEMAKTSAALFDAIETPSINNKAALFLALKNVNLAFFTFLQESGIAYLHTQENQGGSLTNNFAAELKKAFELQQESPEDEANNAPF